MKNYTLWLVLGFGLFNCSKAKEEPALVSIPDRAFEQKRIDLKIDSDGVLNGQILQTDAQKVDSLKIFSKELAHTIRYLDGLEAFENLVYLDCSGNQIDYLNMSKNAKLRYLNCSGFNAGAGGVYNEAVPSVKRSVTWNYGSKAVCNCRPSQTDIHPLFQVPSFGLNTWNS